MSCFDTAPEFITEDNRQRRGHNPISKEQMIAKHEALFPPEMVRGRSVLDFGSCLGTTGHWCLSNGASYYTGIEVQAEYAQLSQRLLEAHHPGRFAIHGESIERWLAGHQGEQFNVVCLLGVMQVFTNYYAILERVTGMARQWIAVEAIHPKGKCRGPWLCGVQFIDEQPVNLAGGQASAIGRGTRLSPKGLEWLMAEFGFASKEGIIYPRAITDIPDIYNRPLSSDGPVRYLMRLERLQGEVRKSLSRDLQDGTARHREWTSMTGGKST